MKLHSAIDGEPMPWPDGTILLHERGRCVGVVAGGTLHTHNLSMRPARPETWRPVAEFEVPATVRSGYLLAARRRAALAGAER